MNIGIYINPTKEGSAQARERVEKILGELSVDYFSACDVRDFTAKKFDFMFVIGGDGTILHVVSFCTQHNIPILGINSGNIGFMTELESSSVEGGITAFLRGEYKLERRMLLTTTFEGQTYVALNDIVLMRNNSDCERTQIASIMAAVDGSPLYNYKCDGVVCSTPTGSTAYSLSSGGAVLSPNLSAMQIVAICPHSLQTKPVVVEGSSVITLNTKERLSLVIDGKIVGDVSGETQVSRYAKSVQFVKLSDIGFYKRLVKKLSIWSE